MPKISKGGIDADTLLLNRLGKLPPRAVNIARRYPRESDRGKVLDTNKDVWTVEPASDDEHGIKEHFLKATKQKRIKVHKKYGAKATNLPAVPIPAPGTSYNPTVKTHRALMEREAGVQAQLDLKETRLERQLDLFFPSAGKVPTESDHLQEMEAGLFDDVPSDDEAPTEATPADAADAATTTSTLKSEKKTRAQRNKQKLLKTKQTKRSYREAAQRLSKQLKDVDALSKHVRKEEAAQARRRTQRVESTAAARLLRPYKRLGPHQLAPREESVQLPEDLAGSLRQLRPICDGGGTAAEALQETLQRRGVIEPRRRINALKARYKPKCFSKSAGGAVAGEEEAPRRVARRTAPLLT